MKETFKIMLWQNRENTTPIISYLKEMKRYFSEKLMKM